MFPQIFYQAAHHLGPLPLPTALQGWPVGAASTVTPDPAEHGQPLPRPMHQPRGAAGPRQAGQLCTAAHHPPLVPPSRGTACSGQGGKEAGSCPCPGGSDLKPVRRTPVALSLASPALSISGRVAAPGESARPGEREGSPAGPWSKKAARTRSEGGLGARPAAAPCSADPRGVLRAALVPRRCSARGAAGPGAAGQRSSGVGILRPQRELPLPSCVRDFGQERELKEVLGLPALPLLTPPSPPGPVPCSEPSRPRARGPRPGCSPRPSQRSSALPQPLRHRAELSRGGPRGDLPCPALPCAALRCPLPSPNSRPRSRHRRRGSRGEGRQSAAGRRG